MGVYYGLGLNAGSLPGDIFVNNVINGVFEIASYAFCMFAIDRVGRRRLMCGCLWTAGLGLLCSALIIEFSHKSEMLLTVAKVFAFVGKFGISGSFAVVINFTTELYPTSIRSIAVGTCSMSSRVAGILCPYIILLKHYASWLPNIVFATCGIMAGILSMLLPETNGHKMLDSLEEAEQFYKTGKTKKNKDVKLRKIEDSNIEAGQLIT